jgi:hypothetical protein
LLNPLQYARWRQIGIDPAKRRFAAARSEFGRSTKEAASISARYLAQPTTGGRMPRLGVKPYLGFKSICFSSSHTPAPSTVVRLIDRSSLPILWESLGNIRRADCRLAPSAPQQHKRVLVWRVGLSVRLRIMRLMCCLALGMHVCVRFSSLALRPVSHLGLRRICKKAQVSSTMLDGMTQFGSHPLTLVNWNSRIRPCTIVGVYEPY